MHSDSCNDNSGLVTTNKEPLELTWYIPPLIITPCCCCCCCCCCCWVGTSRVKHWFCQSVSLSVNVLNILWANQFIMNKYNVEGKDSHTWPSVCLMEVKTFPFTTFPAISVWVRYNSPSRILGCMRLYMPSHMLVSIRTRLYIILYIYVRTYVDST